MSRPRVSASVARLCLRRGSWWLTPAVLALILVRPLLGRSRPSTAPSLYALY